MTKCRHESKNIKYSFPIYIFLIKYEGENSHIIFVFFFFGDFISIRMFFYTWYDKYMQFLTFVLHFEIFFRAYMNTLHIVFI
jgi:hypothetical protein